MEKIIQVKIYTTFSPENVEEIIVKNQIDLRHPEANFIKNGFLSFVNLHDENEESLEFTHEKKVSKEVFYGVLDDLNAGYRNLASKRPLLLLKSFIDVESGHAGGNSSAESLSEDYEELFMNMNFADVSIFTSDKKQLEAHKVILSTRSKVFNKMFSHDMTEAKTGIIRIDDFDSKVIKELLRYIYYTKVKNIKEFDIQLYDAADKYEMEKLMKICLLSIARRLDFKNCVEIAVFAKIRNLDHLFSCCLLLMHV
jgi:hypothetical protein